MKNRIKTTLLTSSLIATIGLVGCASNTTKIDDDGFVDFLFIIEKVAIC